MVQQEIDKQTRDARCQEAEYLTALMREQRPFSYLRLGDGEVNWILRMQGDESAARLRYGYKTDAAASVEMAYSVTGLEEKHYERLLNSYRRCTYLDLYDRRPFNFANNPRLGLNRDSSLYSNRTPETSMIFYEWTFHEFGKYIAGRRCLFAGAEAPLLGELWNDAQYREIASHFWPEEAQPFFVGVRDNGRNYSENLDLIKEDLRKYIQENNIDTLFISLATGAKIIAQELAEELGICTYDFGSMMRALTYSGTPGYHSFRSFHNPFMFLLPLDVYMPALERAHPEMSDEERVAKAHGQLCFDLQRKEVMSSFPTDTSDSANFDTCEKNLRAFNSNLAYYNKVYKPLAKKDEKARFLIKDFRRWRLKKGLGWEGQIFVTLVKVKRKLRSLVGR